MRHLRPIRNDGLRATLPLHTPRRKMSNTDTATELPYEPCTEPRYRLQYDCDREAVSLATGTDTGPESLTRQEFADEADLNVLLARFGVNTPVRPMIYGGEVDYQLDLQQAFAAIESARRANMAVPDELRQKYPDWRKVLNGAESGEYQRDLKELSDRRAAEEAAKKVAPN
ncbi:internal scaffolding protein [Blackfly microvirus SF02]|uniref:Internal scaffolding protein n=1 Tax=Blackfly microvirus SF02 TaxID=2576452 RepID=A0A4P8PSU2_9VIRU|nr:internal scaffolding protein [Blackfly microvirus SF02]